MRRTAAGEIGDHPELVPGGVVEQERSAVAVGVEETVGLHQRPVHAVVGVDDGATTAVGVGCGHLGSFAGDVLRRLAASVIHNHD
jgi:hypothetical protein